MARKDGRAPIYPRITLNGQRSEISLGMRINPEVWDQENGQLKGVSHENLLTNSQITQAKANLEKHLFLLTTQFAYVSADMVKKSYQSKTILRADEDALDEKKTFMQAVAFKIDRFREKTEKRIRAASTLRRWEITRNKLAALFCINTKKQIFCLKLSGRALQMMCCTTI